MKNLVELNIAEQIFTLSQLFAVMQDAGVVDCATTETGGVFVGFADDAGVDRAFSALVALKLGLGIVFDPYEARSTDNKKRWRSAVLCLGNGNHIFLSGPHRPVMQAV